MAILVVLIYHLINKMSNKILLCHIIDKIDYPVFRYLEYNIIQHERAELQAQCSGVAGVNVRSGESVGSDHAPRNRL